MVLRKERGHKISPVRFPDMTPMINRSRETRDDGTSRTWGDFEQQLEDEGYRPRFIDEDTHTFEFKIVTLVSHPSTSHRLARCHTSPYVTANYVG